MENEFILYVSSNEDVNKKNDCLRALLSSSHLKVCVKDTLVEPKQADFYRIRGTTKNLIHFIKKVDHLFPKISFELFEFRNS